MSQDFPDHYYGEIVDNYERERTSDPTWDAEQAVVAQYVELLDDSASLLDAPVGTGRFLSHYAQRNCQVTALDLSTDMLARSEQVASRLGLPLRSVQGSVLELPFEDNEVDHLVSFRLLTWFREDQFARSLHEMGRVTRLSMLLSFHLRRDLTSVKNPINILRYLKMHRSQQMKMHARDPHIRLHKRSSALELVNQAGLKLTREHCIKAGRVSDYVAWELHPI